MTQVLTPALIVLFGFVSHMWGASTPTPLAWLGSALPLRHADNAVPEQFDSIGSCSGWYADHLARIALWTVIGAVVAERFFTWEVCRRSTSASVADVALSSMVPIPGHVTWLAAPAREALNPTTMGSGLGLGPLAGLVAWTAVRALVVCRRLSAKPPTSPPSSPPSRRATPSTTGR